MDASQNKRPGKGPRASPLETFVRERPFGSQRLAVILLAAGQTLVWAALYYSFAALLLTWERNLGWSKSELTLGLAAAVLVSAVGSPMAGRIIDAGFGRWLLSLGALGGGAALALLATAETPLIFVLIWSAIGVAQAACLYEPCFAFITRVSGSASRRVITRVTLVAGFASPIAFPTGALLAHSLGWQGAVLVMAAVVVLIAAPMLFIGASLLEAGSAEVVPAERRKESRALLKAAAKRPQFWLIALAFPAMAMNHGILINHIVPLLVDSSFTEATAVTIASVIGPMQVAGRVGMMLSERRVGSLTLTILAFAGVALAALFLMLAGASLALAFAFAATQGAAYGIISILKPVVTADFLGRAAFGSIAGWLALPYLACYAVAPFVGALLWEIGGYDLVIPAAGAIALLGIAAVSLLALTRSRRA